MTSMLPFNNRKHAIRLPSRHPSMLYQAPPMQLPQGPNDRLANCPIDQKKDMLIALPPHLPKEVQLQLGVKSQEAVANRRPSPPPQKVRRKHTWTWTQT